MATVVVGPARNPVAGGWFEKTRLFEPDSASSRHAIDRYYAQKMRDIKADLEHLPQMRAQLEKLRVDLAEIRLRFHSGVAVDRTQPQRKKRKVAECKSADGKVVSFAEMMADERRIKQEIDVLETRIPDIEEHFEEQRFLRKSQKMLNDHMAMRASWNEFERELRAGTLDPRAASQAVAMRQHFNQNLEEITNDFVLEFFPDDPRAVRVRAARSNGEIEFIDAEGTRPGSGQTPDASDGRSYICDGAVNGCNWSYDEDRCAMKPLRKYNYRRINHLREFLRQQQGDSNIRVSADCMEAIRAELKKRRVQPEKASYNLVRRILKSMDGCEKLFEHAQYITRLLNPNYKLLRIEPEHEFKLCQRFIEIEIPFEKIKSRVVKARKNFMR